MSFTGRRQRSAPTEVTLAYRERTSDCHVSRPSIQVEHSPPAPHFLRIGTRDCRTETRRADSAFANDFPAPDPRSTPGTSPPAVRLQVRDTRAERGGPDLQGFLRRPGSRFL